MTSNKMLGFLAVFVLGILMVSSVTAFASLDDLEVKDVESGQVSVFGGETFPVRVVFTATADAEDVRVKAWISGERENAVVSERFDVLDGNTYSRLISVTAPFDIDPEEDLSLNVVVENRNQEAIDETFDLVVQRESYLLQILDVEADTSVRAGGLLALDVVLKNSGRQFADDAFVRVKIPALGIEDRSYFGDLSSTDQPFSKDPFTWDDNSGDDRLDKEDTAEGRLFLRIPTSAPTGLYVVEIEAFNEDSVTQVTRKVAVVGAVDTTRVVSAVSGKTFAVGDNAEYAITLVNTGNQVEVYELVMETSGGLTLEVSEPVVALPAGTSKTVTVEATGVESGDHAFAVNVYSDNELVQKVNLTANVADQGFTGNATVLLTVVLVIIFVVLLVVLIVLLTRKPEKSEEFGESYY